MERPPEGWLKFNFDGVSKCNHVQAGSSGLVHGFNNSISFTLLGRNINTQAKFQALIMGGEKSLSQGFKKIIFKDD